MKDWEKEAREVSHSVGPMDFGSTAAIKVSAKALQSAYRQGLLRGVASALKVVSNHCCCTNEELRSHRKCVTAKRLTKDIKKEAGE